LQRFTLSSRLLTLRIGAAFGLVVTCGAWSCGCGRFELRSNNGPFYLMEALHDAARKAAERVEWQNRKS
jgi:hypothetical protein